MEVRAITGNMVTYAQAVNRSKEKAEYSVVEDSINQKQNWTKALSKPDATIKGKSAGEIQSVIDTFKMQKKAIIEEHKLTPDTIRQEKDWRKMDDEQWDKLIKRIDKYIEDLNEQLDNLEEKQEAAAMKAVAAAPANMRTAAISKAMLKVMTNGIIGADTNGNATNLEKSSWTYKMQTDDQAILAKAKTANAFVSDMISKSQELALFGDTSAGISETDNVKECASLDEYDKRKKEKNNGCINN